MKLCQACHLVGVVAGLDGILVATSRAAMVNDGARCYRRLSVLGYRLAIGLLFAIISNLKRYFRECWGYKLYVINAPSST